MGRGGQKEKFVVSEQQKWDYITLSDFKAKSCGPLFSYIWLWILIFITIAVYTADTFTAVNLIGFNKWTSGLTPKIDLKVAKWIFSGCIILSWTLAIWSWIMAFMTMRRGCVTDDYLDDLAVVLQSIRCGTGWQRFLVFAELTKSKKKVSWIALFVYFQRKGAIRLLAADGPRQVVNAITLWSVVSSELINANADNVKRSGFDQFFHNLQVLGESDKKQVIVLSTMAFTLIIWALFMLFLILALILYIVFLWHFIKNETLTGFCRQKVETRLARIVKAKTDKILAKQQAKWEKMERKGASQISLASTLPPKFTRKPTLPTIGGSPPTKSELYRSVSSTSTLPLYSLEPPAPVDGPGGMRRVPTLPNITEAIERPLPPSSSTTGLSDASSASYASYASNAPLLSKASSMGYSGPISRPGTSNSQRTFNGSMVMQGQGRPPLPPMARQGPPGPRYPPPARSNTGFSMQSRESHMSAGTPYTPAGNGRPFMGSYDHRTQSPAQHAQGGSYERSGSYEMTPVESRGYENGYFPPQAQQDGAYFRGPSRSQSQTPSSEYSSQTDSNVGLPGALQIGGARRDMSAPGPPRSQLPWPPTQRSATAPIQEDPRGRSRGPGPGYGMHRSATAGPQGQGHW
ncbi:hypothetical protein E2P81_ATG05405 [Venturia nashicola]|uniref:Pheromone-regulated membrane protein n=1 Tax=Venturia nashicola TaxID=86259 RepID=A0A4Z1NXU0_9PEZI|nr:hypothetical protein E6O75_ATG05541 [Venturia nashicola]TLD32429.1 hypothetical protein E2P81_ATG05405 [Venturia nashicola]